MPTAVARMNPARKRDQAIDFIRQIRAMDRETLNHLILAQAGEELARFFLTYASDLMNREPHRATENASSLLLIGYLIRCFEEDADRRTVAPASTFVQ
jgi:hypothetical protein